MPTYRAHLQRCGAAASTWSQYSSRPTYGGGRLAALAGDTAGAVSAYRHYLTLQAHSEPALEPRMKHIRAELVRL
jgi:hypothetical protein